MSRNLALLLLAATAAAPSAATNLIQDGDFELTSVEAGGYSHFAGNTSFDGGAWHVTGTDVLLVDTGYHSGANPPIVFNAQSGSRSLDLTGTGNSGPGDGVYQDIVTEIGKQYLLTFFVGHASTTGSDQNFYLNPATVRLSIDGGALQEFTNAATVTSGIAWQSFTQSFTATSALTRIAFLNGTGNDYLGLDNVSVVDPTAVPEPGSLMTWLAGLGLVAFACRRRAITSA